MPGAHNIDFGAIARTNVDLYVDDIEFEIKDKEFALKVPGDEISILVDETPLLDVDKVTSLTTQ